MIHSTAYVNGTVYTMEREGERCSAFVVRDGKFVYCGEDDAAKRLADEVVDLHGAAVLPGMIAAAAEYLETEGENTFFLAVGAGHMVDPGGIVSGLRELGYTVELVPAD